MWRDESAAEIASAGRQVRGPRASALATIALLGGLLSMAAGVAFLVALVSVLTEAAQPYRAGPRASGLQISPLQIATTSFICAGILIGAPVAMICGCVSWVLHRSHDPLDYVPRRCGLWAILTGLSGWIMVGTGLFLVRTVLGPALAH